MSELENIAKQMVAKGKGILAADESTGTMTKRLSSVSVESTSENRLKFRETLFSAKSMKENIGGVIVKDNNIYKLRDNTALKNLVLSSTLLHPGKQTTGHEHQGQEEVYFFVTGSGEMLINEERFEVNSGDIVLIEDGEFHCVHNTSQSDLYFVCVFDGSRNH